MRVFSAWLSGGLLLAASASAQPELDWRAPAGCLTREQAAAALEVWLGDRAESTAVKVEIVQRESSFEAAIEFSGSVRGERRLTAASCSSLSDAVVLIVAITLDPLRVSQHLTSPPSAPQPAAAPAAPPQPAAAAPPAPADSPRASLALQLPVDWGSLPQVSIAAGAQIGLTLGRVSLALEGSYWLQRFKRLEPDGAAGAEVGLWEGRARGCYDVLQGSDLAFGPCAAFALGVMSGEGVELLHPNPEAQLAPWALGSLGAHVRQSSHPLFVDAGLELGLSILRPVYEVDQKPVFQPGPWAGRAWIGVGWSLP